MNSQNRIPQRYVDIFLYIQLSCETNPMKIKRAFTEFYYINSTKVTPQFPFRGNKRINELILRIRGVNCKLKYFKIQILLKKFATRLDS